MKTEAERNKLALEISSNIELFCQNHYDDGHRSHLGASLIGDHCTRKLWYTFRHVCHKKHSGQLYRLFNRGHREEERFVTWLRGAGIEVSEFDPNWNPEDKIVVGKYKDKKIDDVPEEYLLWARNEGVDLCKKQYRVTGVNGHFGGSLDGIATLPTNERLLLEFKTFNDRTFKLLLKSGVRSAKPVHFTQMSVYGYKYELQYAIYMAINKNTDELYVDVVELDWSVGIEMERKAEHIINKQEEPPKLHENDSHFDCKFCDYRLICHFDDHIEMNCRSCKHAFPVEKAEWLCNYWGEIIPKANIKDGCGNWEGVC